ncbi:DUF692 domain-containing protein [bacterium]|nr:DUF692 domain-containing protein [bacterium]
MKKRDSLFPDLGVGIGFRREFASHFSKQIPHPVSWIEVVTENYMAWENDIQPPAIKTLQRLRKEIPIVLHGVSLSIGSADPLNPSYLKRWKSLIDAVEPAWVSDHLCWTGVNGENLHDLMPLPYTEEALQHVANKIDQVQTFLKRRILIENVSSYVEFNQSAMTEWEFINELLKRADCGLLLDVNNVYVSSKNHGFNPLDYLRAIPRNRVGQIHLAGHSDLGTHLIDTHDEPICEEVWRLYEWSREHFGPVSAMVERDGNFPRWEELEKELLRVKEIQTEVSDYGYRLPQGKAAQPFEISAAL